MESSKGVWSICRAWASEPAWATTSRTGSCPRKKARDWRKAAWSSTSMTLTILIALMSAFSEARADETVMIPFSPYSPKSIEGRLSEVRQPA